jgi:ABC-type glycerol-3-phosphate transport system substrate-binding protein
MMIMGHWPQAALRANPEIDLGVAGMPSYVRRANVLFWSGFGIADGSPNKAAAWRLLRFYTGEQAARTWSKWGLPTVKSVAEQLGLASDPIEGVWLAELAHLAPRAYVFTPYWNTTADPAIREVLKNVILFPGFDVPNALDQAARDAQAALDIRY